MMGGRCGGGKPFPSEGADARIKAALAGPSGEVLRVMAAQPYRSWRSKHLVDPSVTVPVVRR